ncbi:MAG TPA: OmpH family outer membrane protein [Edaphobacter sp.]|jgi:outer membrane protein|nr:OmpH family outer membrane protein [Edaphobacter sp.]
MNRNVALVTAFAAGMLSAAGAAQTTGSTTPAPATAPAPVPVQVVQAKIAVIEYEQVTAATNEGQRALQALQKKYEPQKNQLQALQTEIDSLTKQLQSAPATMGEDERASRARTIDTKQKQLQRDGEDATNAFNAEMQDTLGAIAKKMGPIVIKYVQDNGYTLLLDNTGQQGGLAVLWTAPGTTDISQAIVDAYNASSGVAAPAVPSAPAANRPRPAATTPKPAATPHQ